MLYDALSKVVQLRNSLDHAALAMHCCMLEHGFICTGLTETEPGASSPTISTDPSIGFSLQILPPSWNASPDTFSFGYAHPLRPGETFTVKAVTLAGMFTVHAASSVDGASLHSATLTVDKNAETSAEMVEEWHGKIKLNVASKLLLDGGEAAKAFARVLSQEEEAKEAKPGQTATKRPAPEDDEEERRRRDVHGIHVPRPLWDDRFPGGFDPFSPPMPDHPDHRTPFRPDGGLLGPRHPAFQGIGPQLIRPGQGMHPRVDPVGPGGMEPDNDIFQPPGPAGLPGMPGRRGGPGGPPGFGGPPDYIM